MVIYWGKKSNFQKKKRKKEKKKEKLNIFTNQNYGN